MHQLQFSLNVLKLEIIFNINKMQCAKKSAKEYGKLKS